MSPADSGEACETGLETPERLSGAPSPTLLAAVANWTNAPGSCGRGKTAPNRLVASRARPSEAGGSDWSDYSLLCGRIHRSPSLASSGGVSDTKKRGDSAIS